MNRFQKQYAAETSIRNIVQDNPFMSWKDRLHDVQVSSSKNGLIQGFRDVDCVVKIIPVSKNARQELMSNQFQVWRELAAVRWINHLIKTNVCPNYPMLYYWIVIEHCQANFNNDIEEPHALFLFMEKANLDLCTWIHDLSNCNLKISKCTIKYDTLSDMQQLDFWYSMCFQIFAGI